EAAGHDPADADQRRALDRPRHAGRDADQHRGRGQGRVHRAPRREGRGRGITGEVYMARSGACVVVAAATLIGCSSTPEQPILNQFFTASRLRDNTTLAGFAAVTFDPRTDGIVTAFDITSVSPEQRKPLALRSLARANDDARAADAKVSKRKDEYQAQN